MKAIYLRITWATSVWDDRRLSLADAGHETIPRSQSPLSGLPPPPRGAGGPRRAGGEPHAHESAGKLYLPLVSIILVTHRWQPEWGEPSMWASPAYASEGESDTTSRRVGCGLCGPRCLEVDGPCWGSWCLYSPAFHSYEVFSNLWKNLPMLILDKSFITYYYYLLLIILLLIIIII